MTMEGSYKIVNFRTPGAWIVLIGHGNISHIHMVKCIIMPPMKKGAYCFATVSRYVCLLVCRPNVVCSISLDQYQTWCRGCSQWVDDPYWFSGHKFNGQGQTTLSSPLCCQYLLTASLDQYQTWCRGCPQWLDAPYWFSGHMFNGQGQTTLSSPLCFTWSIPNLVQRVRPMPCIILNFATRGAYIFLKHFLFLLNFLSRHPGKGGGELCII